MSTLPSIFVSHGSPMMAVTESPARAFLAALGTPEPLPPALARWDPADSLEAALLLSITAAAGPSPRLEQLARRLVADQADDGSWKSSPALRITARDYEPLWEAAVSGPLFGSLSGAVSDPVSGSPADVSVPDSASGSGFHKTILRAYG